MTAGRARQWSTTNTRILVYFPEGADVWDQEICDLRVLPSYQKKTLTPMEFWPVARTGLRFWAMRK
jgi:hypothetical protein